MKGEICWRRSGVRAGLGSYGENGLLVTREFGSAIRLAGVLTTADLEPGHPLAEDVFATVAVYASQLAPSQRFLGAE